MQSHAHNYTVHDIRRMGSDVKGTSLPFGQKGTRKSVPFGQKWHKREVPFTSVPIRPNFSHQAFK